MEYTFEFRGKTYKGDAQVTKHAPNTKIELAWKIINLEGYEFTMEFLPAKKGVEMLVRKGERFERLIDNYPPSFMDAIKEFPGILERLVPDSVY